MKRFFCLFILIIALSFAYTAMAASGTVTSWMKAVESGNVGAIKSLLGSGTYYRLGTDKDNNKRLITLRPDDAKSEGFWKMLSGGGEMSLQDERGGGAALEGVAESKQVRGWQQMLALGGGGISSVTDVVTEAVLPGIPNGCPETSYKRDLVATLYGNITGNGPNTIIKAYNFSRNTDVWETVKPGTNPEIEPFCDPRPGVNAEYMEALIMEPMGQVIGYKVVGAALAINDKGNEREEGAKWYRGNTGTSDAVKLIRLDKSGKEGLMTIVSAYRAKGAGVERVDHAVLHEWRGDKLVPIWSFDIGRAVMSSADASPDSEVQIDVSADAPQGGTQYGLKFEVVRAEDDGFDCKVGDTFYYDGTESGYKLSKKGLGKSCLKKWWPGDGILFSALGQEKKGKKFKGDAEDASPWIMK